MKGKGAAFVVVGLTAGWFGKENFAGKRCLGGRCGGRKTVAMCFLIKLKRKADIKQRFSRHSLVPRLLWENITMPNLLVIYQAAIKAEKGLLVTEVTLCRKSP